MIVDTCPGPMCVGESNRHLWPLNLLNLEIFSVGAPIAGVECYIKASHGQSLKWNICFILMTGECRYTKLQKQLLQCALDELEPSSAWRILGLVPERISTGEPADYPLFYSTVPKLCKAQVPYMMRR